MKVKDEDILNLVRTKRIKDQSELKAELNSLGFSLTQASLSRRLKKLNIRKHEGVYKVIESHFSNMGTGFELLGCVLAPPNLLILKTSPGGANAIAYVLDNIIDNIDRHPGFKGMVGTLAGDDTIMVAISDDSRLLPVKKAIMHKFSDS